MIVMVNNPLLRTYFAGSLAFGDFHDVFFFCRLLPLLVPLVHGVGPVSRTNQLGGGLQSCFLPPPKNKTLGC